MSSSLTLLQGEKAVFLSKIDNLICFEYFYFTTRINKSFKYALFIIFTQSGRLLFEGMILV